MALKLRRPTRKELLYAGLGVLCVGFLEWGFLHTEWVEIPIDRGYRKEARGNPFLAAEQFLQRVGIETETVSGLHTIDRLPMSHDTLVLTSVRNSLSQRRIDELFAWVERGGNLIVLARDVYNEDRKSSDDPFLDQMTRADYKGPERPGRHGDH